jgi:hypothetical protein
LTVKYTLKKKNGHLIYHNFPLQGIPKDIKIGIFGVQINHLATLL